jgi:hypothetical protein
VSVEFWLELVDKPEKECPAWAYVGNPRKLAQFGRRIVAVLNLAHWPAAAAVQHKDWRAIRWLVCVAILERLSLQFHPILSVVGQRLSQLAFERPEVNKWESVLWSAYRLKNTSFVAALESVPLSVGALKKIAELTVRISAGKLADWEERKQSQKPAR